MRYALFANTPRLPQLRQVRRLAKSLRWSVKHHASDGAGRGRSDGAVGPEMVPESTFFHGLGLPLKPASAPTPEGKSRSGQIYGEVKRRSIEAIDAPRD